VRVLGVDGCRDGWVAVTLEDGRFIESRFVPRLSALVSDPAETIGIDIPLGDTSPGRRAAESAARKLLGRRAACVFTPPPLACADAAGYEQAKEVARSLTGKAISRQAWNLLPKMVEATALWRDHHDRMREVHPECCFLAMAGEPLLESKTTWEGAARRLRLLRDHGIDLLTGGHTVDRARHDDVLDAAAVAWTAHRIASGSSFSLPDPPEVDGEGRPVAIWV
jgi:predicted RNase H-like nuclease